MKTIKLTRFLTQTPARDQHVWPLKVTAVGVDGAPSAIFVYSQAKPGDPDGDLFQCVASTSQLDELSQAPVLVDGETQTPFYLKSNAEFACRSLADADRIWYVIQQDTLALLQNLNALDNLVANTAVDISADGITATNP